MKGGGEMRIPGGRCNQTVKCRDLLEVARTLGAAALVTGHYVRRRRGSDGVELHRSADKGRDQSYFLFATTREQLAYLRFPLGQMSKDATRALARRFRLPVAAKADSQDICFVAGGAYGRVLERLRPAVWEGGEIVDEGGRVLGRHDGIVHFTVGQRRGLGVAAAEPLYVVRIEPAARRVVVGPRRALERRRLQLREVNWLGSGEPPARGLEVEVKLRSTQDPVAARVTLVPGGRGEVTLAEPQPGVAPGQACVFYRGDRVLGGGWIEREAAAG